MKAHRTKRRLITAIALFAILLLGFAVLSTYGGNQRLTSDQIATLREQYPLCGDMSTVMGSMRYLTMEESIKEHDTFVYGTVEGEMSTRSKYISTGDPELDKKRQENGIGDVYSYYSYTISVIEDSEGIYKAGDKIEIESPTAFINFNPQLSDGMKIVVPIEQVSESDTLTYFVAEGMYYVTEDEYVLSVVDETVMRMKEPLTGVKVKKLLAEVKKRAALIV